jgi:hypothetical protein
LIPPTEEAGFPVLEKIAYGLDVIVRIGELRLEEGRSLPQVHRSLVADGVPISERHVANLFRLFLALSHCLDVEHEPLRSTLVKQGRLILGVDGVAFDHSSQVLFVVRELLSKSVLCAERVLKHDTETLARMLRTVAALGVPIEGVVSDKEAAVVAGVREGLPGVPHQYCQTHYLGNLVKPMADDLSLLGKQVAQVVAEVRRLEKDVTKLAKESGAPEAEVTAVQQLIQCAKAAGTVSGDPILDPAAVKKHKRLGAVADTARGLTRRPGTWALLKSLVTVLAQLETWSNMAQRLSWQVEIVGNVASILDSTDPSVKVMKRLNKYI